MIEQAIMFKEDDMWVVKSEKHNIAAYGESRFAAINSFKKILLGQAIVDNDFNMKKAFEKISDHFSKMSDEEFTKELEKHKDGDIAMIFMGIWGEVEEI